MSRSQTSRLAPLVAAVGLAIGLGGCNLFTRLSEVGSEPTLSEISNPVAHPDYRPVSMPMPPPQIIEDNPNSLWRPGAKAFFKDIRAKERGDILTVKLSVDNSAKLANDTTRQRDASENTQLNTVLGYDNPLQKIFKDADNPSTLLDFGSTSQTLGNGDIDREEQIELELAAVVIQVLPNGSLVILGRQELRVNFELRQLLVHGIVRREDIEADNTITHDKIAEMRLAYGGRGTLSDLQQPRWGTQVWDILSPF